MKRTKDTSALFGSAKALFVLLLLVVPFMLTAANSAFAQDPFSGNPVAKIARELSPAVVNIDVETMVTRSIHPFADDPFFRQFFGEEHRRFSRTIPMKGRGSGFIVSKDGHILTNNHVIDGADKITVTFSDGRTFEAKVLGKDPTFDLAVIKIDAKDLPFLELGDSDATEVGEWVVAIGNPFGLEHTVTVGVVSAKNRSIHAENVNFDGFLQTDAAINPGNSGGPLLNLGGEVVGINTAIVPFAQGIGFAVPVNMAKQVMDDLIEFGRVKRGWLGVYIQSLTKEFAEAYGVKEENGAVVSDVLRDSPAEKAGLQRGDVILEVNGSGVKNHQEFVMKIRQKLAGEKVTLTIIRQKKNIKVDVTLDEMPGNEKQTDSRIGGSKMLTNLGLEVGEMTEDIRKQNNLRKDEGVLITAVEDGAMAQRAGIRENDVLLEVNGVRLSGLSDLDKADVKGNSVVLLIMRDSRSFFVSIRTGQ